MTQISIIITSYNYEKYIEKSIVSCLQQKNFDDYEIIVVDDGSSDNTKLILEKYSKKIRYYLNNNQGIEATSNFAIQKSHGMYVVRVDADDMLEDNYLTSAYQKITTGTCDFVYSEYFVVDCQDQILYQKHLPPFEIKEIQSRGDFLATGTLYKKTILEQAGFYNEQTKNSGLENYELILQLLKNGFQGECIHDPLFYYRQHTSNISITKKDLILDYGKKIAQRFQLSDYMTNENHPWGLKL